MHNDEYVAQCTERISSELLHVAEKHNDDHCPQTVNHLYHKPFLHNTTEKSILNWMSSTKNFLKDHLDILFMNADKGNMTVAIHKNTYLYKMNLLLSDESTYEVVTVDPTRKIINGLKTHLNRWRQKGFISKSIYLSLLSSDGTLPRAYGLPKVHKDNCPLRIIVSCINSPLYKLAMFLHNVLHNSIPKPDSHIKNSFQLIDMLKDKIIDDDTDLVSLDVVSLFTNVPSELAIADTLMTFLLWFLEDILRMSSDLSTPYTIVCDLPQR
ncbi:uncharacterized protein [Linepithema humile]|uniref:uncharacterized protein n=1 Tax=Linepithema humile TaxID=83485 RepID=UPI00351E275F